MSKINIKSLIILVCVGFFLPANAEQERPKGQKGQCFQQSEIQRYIKFHLASGLQQEIIFQEDFETNTWPKSGSWACGKPVSGPRSGYMSPNCAATNLNGNYPNNSNDWLISHLINLPPSGGIDNFIKMYFWEWFALESNYDFGYVKITQDQGRNWVTLDYRTGFSNWRETFIDLTAYAGNKVNIAFQLTSDAINSYPGWYIDNIKIIYEKPEPLSARMVSMNPQNFPFIYMNVEVDTFDVGYPDLIESNFRIFEDNVLQTYYFEVTPPESGGGSRLADIIFVLDVTGSMEQEINAVKQNMLSFVNALSASDINYGVGFVVFGDIFYSYNYGNLYYSKSDILYIINNIRLGEHEIGTGGDFPENQLGALDKAASMNFRPGAQKVLILLTDADAHEDDWITKWTIPSIIARLKSSNLVVYPIFDNSIAEQISQYVPIAQETNPNGFYYHIYDNFNEIISQISTNIACNYLLRYRTSNDELDGIERKVKVIVTHAGNEAICEGKYIPGSVPVIRRTQETIALHDRAWTEYTKFYIRVEIDDNAPPYVQNAILYFKNTLTDNYQEMSMVNIGGNIWQGIISTNFVRTPGVDYYITATDGENTASDPSVDPRRNPYQIAILPNYAPSIIHNPVKLLEPGIPILISAQITDNTNYLAGIKLYYRKVGQLIYQEIDMENKSPDIYESEIPASFVSLEGIEYYIKAWDDFGVSSSHGTANNPHLIKAMTLSLSELIQIKRELIDLLEVLNEIQSIPVIGFETELNWSTGYDESDISDLLNQWEAQIPSNEDFEKSYVIQRLNLAEHALKDIYNRQLDENENYNINEIPGALEMANDCVGPLVDAFLIIIPAIRVVKKTNQYVDGIRYKPEWVKKKFKEFTYAILDLCFSLVMKAAEYGVKHSSMPPEIANPLMDAIEMIRGILTEGEFLPENIMGGMLEPVLAFPLLDAGYIKPTQEGIDFIATNARNFFYDSDFLTAEKEVTFIVEEIGRETTTIHNNIKIARELSDIYSTIGDLTTLAGAIPSLNVLIAVGQVIKGISIMTYAIEAGVAGYELLHVLPPKGINATQNAFYPDDFKYLDLDNKDLMVSSANPLLYKINFSIGKYEEILFQLKNALEKTDLEILDKIIDNLLIAETNLELSFNVGKGKLIGAVRSARNIEEFEDAYNAAIEVNWNSTVERIYLYILLANYLVEQTEDKKEEILQKIESVLEKNDQVINGIRNAILLLENYNTPIEPTLVVSSVKFDRDLKTKKTYEIFATIKNVGTSSSLNASTRLSVYPDTVAALINSLKQLDTIAAGDSIVTSWQYSINDVDSADAIIDIILDADSTYTIPFYATVSIAPDLTPGTQGRLDNDNIYIYPNPFNPDIEFGTIRYSLAKDADVTIKIYDIANNLVRILIENSSQISGEEQYVEWDGRNDKGETVTNGVYFYLIESSAGERAVGKIGILR